MSDNEHDALLSTILGGAVLTITGTIISKASGFAVKSVLAHQFGPDGYGVLILGYSAVTTFLFVGKLGFPAALARYIPQTDSWGERRNYIATSLLITILVSTVLTGVFWIAADWIAIALFGDRILTNFIRVFAVAFPFLALIKVISGVFRGFTDARSRTLIQEVFRPLLRLSLTGAVILSGLPLLWVANAWLAAFVGTALAGVLLLRYVEPRAFGPLSSISRIEYFKFAFPLMITSAMGTLLGNTDTLLVGGLLGSRAVGIYNVAFTLSTLIIAVYTGFGVLFLPIFAGLADKGDTEQMKRVYSTVTKWMTLILAPVYLTLAALAPTILNLMFGAEFVEGSTALSILLTGMYLRAATGLGGQALTAVGKPNVVAVANVVGVVLNIVLNLLLIPRYGLIGAAIATSAVSAGLDGMYFVYLNRHFGINITVKRTVIPLLFGASLSIPILVWLRQLSLHGMFMLLLAGSITMLIFIGAFLQFGIEDQDRRIYETVRNRR